MPLLIGWVIAVGIALGFHHHRDPAQQQTVFVGYVQGSVSAYHAEQK